MQLDTMSITVASFLPFILATINQPKFSSSTKQIIGLVSVVLVGVAVPVLQGKFDFANIMANTGIVFATMQSVYAGLNKTGLWDNISNATSPKTVGNVANQPPADYSAGDATTEQSVGEKNKNEVVIKKKD